MKGLTMMMFLLLSCTVGIAQEDGDKDNKDKKHEKLSPDERAEKRTDHMIEILGLTDDQAVEVRAINLAFAKEMERIHAEMKKLKEEAKAQKEKTKKEIDKVLNEEQKEKMDAEMKKRHDEKDKGRKERCCQDKE